MQHSKLQGLFYGYFGRYLVILIGCFVFSFSLAWAETQRENPETQWEDIVEQARGQSVYFNAWGGSEQINAYIQWVADEVLERYDIELIHVKLTDTAQAVARILAEKQAGEDDAGSVDLIWINGENFSAMKNNGLLGEPFVDTLPNFVLVDIINKPTTLIDFTIPTEGLESPWGMAQLTFFYDSAYVEEPPRSLEDLLDFVKATPGRFTYPRIPDFHGTTFLKQLLHETITAPSLLYQPVVEDDFLQHTAPLWAFLDELHPHLWRRGTHFPSNAEEMIQLLNDGELFVIFNFNPAAASAAIEDGRLPDTVRGYMLAGGTIGNTHFVAIPFNARARAAAMVVANFLLSPDAQIRKEDPRIWGDPTVLDIDRLSFIDQQRLNALPRGLATPAPQEMTPVLPEPHPSWTRRLEEEWLNRYGQ